MALAKQRVVALERLLAGLDPRATLKRGYAIVRHEGKVLRDAASVKAGNALMIQLSQGKIGAHVDESGR